MVEHKSGGGLNWFVAGLFIVAQLAGGGIVALPTAVIQSGLWTGLMLNVMLTVMAASTSIMLGKCWVLLQRRWPAVYRAQHCREPYPQMCQRALGSKFRKLASLNIQLNQFGIAVVFLLLSSKNIQHFLKAFFEVDISFCLLVLVLALALFPFTMLKSPEDFCWAAVMSVCTTTFAVILICLGAALDAPACAPQSVGMPPQFRAGNYFVALGTILFAYGGHPGFPTIQHDMRRPELFTRSSVVAFTVLAILYLPTCCLGYFVYGNSLRESIMNSIQHNWIQHAASFLITGHAIFSVIIVLNPINQIAERKFNVPQEFGLRRVLVRGAVFLLVVFVAESVPTFGPLLNLSGGSTQTATALIFPCICFLFLNAAERRAAEKETANERLAELKLMGKNGEVMAMEMQTNKMTSIEEMESDDVVTLSYVLTTTDRKTLFCCIFIIAFGLLGGGAATFSAIRELTGTHFVPPCYVSLLMASLPNDESLTKLGSINCCGPYQNISIRGDFSTCSKPDLHFYD